MPTRYLITGVNGFTGRHLAERLKCEANGVVLGTGRRANSTVALDGYFSCDLTDPHRVAEMIDWACPDIVFHLAGLLGGAPHDELMRVNVAGFENLCDELASHSAGRTIRLLALGSAAELGSSGAARLPVTDDAPCQPETPYGKSKHAMIRYALGRPTDSPLQIVAVRPFNLVGPGLDARMALGNFARQLAAARRGETDTISCGALNTRRDYLDVRDAADAYVLAAVRGIPGQIYNVCSGHSSRIGDLLLQMIDLANVRVRVVESAAAGPADLLDIYGNAGKLTRLTGWQPTIPLATSLRELIESTCERSPGFNRAPTSSMC